MTANHPAFSENNMAAFFDSLFLAQGLHTLNYLSFNVPAWSISTEFCAYLVFAAVVFVFPTRVATLVISSFLCTICFAILIALGPIGVPLSENFGIIRCLLGFFFGALVYAFYDFVRATPLPGKHPKLSGRIAVLSILAFVGFLANKRPGYSDLCVYPLSALVILLISLSPKISATRFL